MDADPKLSPEQIAQLEEARARAGAFLGAAKVAAFNGWAIGVFAALTLLLGFRSPPALVLGVGMAVVARNEFRGRARLRALDAGAPRLLGRNQMGFMALIVVYCLWSLALTFTDPDPRWQQLEDLAGLEAGFVQSFLTAVYLGVVAATVVFQGLNARYYFRRGPMVEAYLSETPEWVVKLQRSASVD